MGTEFIAFIIADALGLAVSGVQMALEETSAKNRKKIEDTIKKATEKYQKGSDEYQRLITSAATDIGLLTGVASNPKPYYEAARAKAKKAAQKKQELDELNANIGYAQGVESAGNVYKKDVSDVESRLGGSI